MIRDFILGDEKRLKPNAYSDVSDLSDVFTDDNYIKYTLEDRGEIKCILCWWQYEPRKYAIFFLMPEHVGLIHAREIKKFLDKKTNELNPKLCLTYSFDCDMLNRWHEFFGFEKKDENSVFIEGKKFNKWVIKWA